MFVNSLTITIAQESTITIPQESSSLVKISPSILEFSGNEEASISRKIEIIGISPKNVNVTIFKTDLYDNTTAKNFQENIIEISDDNFILTQNKKQNVNVTLNTKEDDSGTYYGKIIITAHESDNATKIESFEIEVVAKISVVKKPDFVQDNILDNTELIIIIVAFFAILFLDNYVSQKIKFQDSIGAENLVTILMLIITILAGITYIQILRNEEFGDLNLVYTALSTAFVTPIFTQFIAHVNALRSNRTEKIKTARDTMRKGIDKDIDVLRNFIGEFANHYASFKPNSYEESEESKESKESNENSVSWWKKTFTTSTRILYRESGKLSKKFWEENCREGMISNIPTLRLEKYYDLVEVYNKYYSHLIKTTSSKKFQVVFNRNTDRKYEVSSVTFDNKETKNKEFIQKFETFRYRLADLQTVLYVHLLYNLGLISKEYVAPLITNYPRVNRLLFNFLVQYGILNPEKYVDKIDLDKKFKKDFLIEYKKKYPEQLIDQDKKPINDEDIKKTEEYRAKKFGKIIDDWLLDSETIRKILIDVYHEDKIQIFLREVEKDYIKNYKLTKKAMNELLQVPKEDAKDEEKPLAINANVQLKLKKDEKEQKQQPVKKPTKK